MRTCHAAVALSVLCGMLLPGTASADSAPREETLRSPALAAFRPGEVSVGGEIGARYGIIEP